MSWGFTLLLGAVAVPVVGVLVRLYIKFTSGRARNIPRLDGKTVFITGGTSGIGKETVKALAGAGARVYMTGRNREVAEGVANDIRLLTGNKSVFAIQLNLCDFDSVRRAANEFLAKENSLHILINNAGMSAGSSLTRLNNGLEETMAGNHFGPFLLTKLFLDCLERSSPSRVVTVSSLAHNWGSIDMDNLNYEKGGYGGMKAYCDSKLANILFTVELSNRLRGSGVTTNTLHPGVVGTNLFRRLPAFIQPIMELGYKPFVKNSQEGAQTTIYLATSPSVDHVTGRYFSDCKIAPTKLQAVDELLARQLWEKSNLLTK